MYNWHAWNCPYLKHTVWWVLTCVFTYGAIAKIKVMYISLSTLPAKTLHLRLQVNTDLPSVTTVGQFSFSKTLNGIILCVLFFPRLLLSVMILRFTYAVECIISLFHCWVVCHCIPQSVIHSQVDGPTGCFKYITVTNAAAVII